MMPWLINNLFPVNRPHPFYPSVSEYDWCACALHDMWFVIMTLQFYTILIPACKCSAIYGWSYCSRPWSIIEINNEKYTFETVWAIASWLLRYCSCFWSTYRPHAFYILVWTENKHNTSGLIFWNPSVEHGWMLLCANSIDVRSANHAYVAVVDSHTFRSEGVQSLHLKCNTCRIIPGVHFSWQSHIHIRLKLCDQRY